MAKETKKTTPSSDPQKGRAPDGDYGDYGDDSDTPAEWLLTNRFGSFAMGSPE